MSETKYRIVEEIDFDGNTSFFIEKEFQQTVYKEQTLGGLRGYNDPFAIAKADDTQLVSYWMRASAESYDTFAKAKETLDRINFKPKRVYHNYEYENEAA